LADISCNKIVRDDGHLKVIGPIIVGGTTYQDYIVRGEEIHEVEERCHLKG
jgi:hypothetical protein